MSAVETLQAWAEAQQRAARVEEDLLVLLREFRDLRRKNEKRIWRKQ